MNLKTISTYLPEETLKVLNTFREATGLSRNSIVNQAINSYLLNQTNFINENPEIKKLLKVTVSGRSRK